MRLSIVFACALVAALSTPAAAGAPESSAELVVIRGSDDGAAASWSLQAAQPMKIAGPGMHHSGDYVIVQVTHAANEDVLPGHDDSTFGNRIMNTQNSGGSFDPERDRLFLVITDGNGNANVYDYPGRYAIEIDLIGPGDASDGDSPPDGHTAGTR